MQGLGGQGKTELAVAYAHGGADSYPGGLWSLGAEGALELLPRDAPEPLNTEVVEFESVGHKCPGMPAR